MKKIIPLILIFGLLSCDKIEDIFDKHRGVSKFKITAFSYANNGSGTIEVLLEESEGAAAYEVGVYKDSACTDSIRVVHTESVSAIVSINLLPGSYFLCATAYERFHIVELGSSCGGFYEVYEGDQKGAGNNGVRLAVDFEIFENSKDEFRGLNQGGIEPLDDYYGHSGFRRKATHNQFFYDRFSSMLISGQSDIVFSLENHRWIRVEKERDVESRHYWLDDSVLFLDYNFRFKTLKLSRLLANETMSVVLEVASNVRAATVQDGFLYYITSDETGFMLHQYNIQSQLFSAPVLLNIDPSYEFWPKISPLDFFVAGNGDLILDMGLLRYSQTDGLTTHQLQTDLKLGNLHIIAAPKDDPNRLYYGYEEIIINSFKQSRPVTYCSYSLPSYLERREVFTLDVTDFSLAKSNLELPPESIRLDSSPFSGVDRGVRLAKTDDGDYIVNLDVIEVLPIRGEKVFVVPNLDNVSIYDFSKAIEKSDLFRFESSTQ